MTPPPGDERAQDGDGRATAEALLALGELT
jgi:hypothetical protein